MHFWSVSLHSTDSEASHAFMYIVLIGMDWVLKINVKQFLCHLKNNEDFRNPFTADKVFDVNYEEVCVVGYTFH